MSLLVTKVPRSLESKTKMFGFELGDLLLIFIYLALSNLIFRHTSLKIPAVWGGTLAIAGVLYFVKRKTPDQFLQHWGEFWRSPDIYTANSPDIDYQPYLKKETEADDYEKKLI